MISKYLTNGSTRPVCVVFVCVRTPTPSAKGRLGFEAKLSSWRWTTFLRP